MIVCPKCRHQNDRLEEWDMVSVINGVRIQIKCPNCYRYTVFVNEEITLDEY